MNENETKARKALKVWKQERAWRKWVQSPDSTPPPLRPPSSVISDATQTLAAFAAEILERNP